MFKLSWHSVLQVCGCVIQLGNVLAVPQQYKPYVAGVVGLAQYIVHQYGYLATPPAK